MSDFFCPNCRLPRMIELQAADMYSCTECFCSFMIKVLPSAMEQKLFHLVDVAKDPKLVDLVLDMVRRNDIDKGVSL